MMGAERLQHGHDRRREDEYGLPRVGSRLVAKVVPKTDPKIK